MKNTEDMAKRQVDILVSIMVLLKPQPYWWFQKMAPLFCGSFEILKCIRAATYCRKLPQHSKIHYAFTLLCSNFASCCLCYDTGYLQQFRLEVEQHRNRRWGQEKAGRTETLLSHYDQGMGVSGLQDTCLEIVSDPVIHIEITHIGSILHTTSCVRMVDRWRTKRKHKSLKSRT